jgi:hypothetical protein
MERAESVAEQKANNMKAFVGHRRTLPAEKYWGGGEGGGGGGGLLKPPYIKTRTVPLHPWR